MSMNYGGAAPRLGRQPTREEPRKSAERHGGSVLKEAIKRVLGEDRLRLYIKRYGEYHFWNVLLKEFVPRSDAGAVLEVASVPGPHLAEFHRLFGYHPYRVETGPENDRASFLFHEVSEENVVFSNFFSTAFQTMFRDRFDVVFSRGLVEHFTNVEGVIASHVNVLAPGGLLIITIPNLKGINYWLSRWFAPESIPLHNLAIMNLPRFRRLFDNSGCEEIYCGYQGSLNLTLASANENSPHAKLLLPILKKVQIAANAALYEYHAARPPEGPRFSSYLAYIGRKAAA